MKTPRQCYSAKLRAGMVDDARAGQVLDMLDGFEREHQARMGNTEAAMRQAALDTADALAAEGARKARLAAGAVKAQADVLRRVAVYADTVGRLSAEGKAPVFLRSPLIGALRSLLVRDPFEIGMAFDNVAAATQRIKGEAHALFAEGIDALRPKALGLKAETTLEAEVLDALFGAPTGDRAGRVAKAFGDTAEHLRRRFNAAGGDIPFRENWRLPNPEHDASKVAAAGREGWKEVARRIVDRAGMIDYDTGRPMTDMKLEAVLDSVFDSIRAMGAEGAPSAAASGRPMLANARSDARVLVFRDADGWREYAGKFGAHASVYQTMLDHIAGLSADTAKLEVLGPNPSGLKRFIDALVAREAQTGFAEADAGDASAMKTAIRANRSAIDRAASGQGHIDALWSRVVDGSANRPVSAFSANLMGTQRSLLVASQLGSAIISSINDPALLVMTARFNGLSATRILARAVDGLLHPDREIAAVQHGFIADSIAGSVYDADRYMGEMIATNRSAKLAGAVIRASGLRRWTSALREAFALEFQATLHNRAGTAFDALPDAFRDTLARYGIAADDWALIGRARRFEPAPGAQFIRHMDIEAIGGGHAQTVATKVARMVNNELDYAVLESDPLTRAVLLGESRPGTAGGETRRAVAMYKTFTATFMLTHMARAFARGWDGSRLAHGAFTFGVMSVLGLLSLQAKHLINGRDPLPVDPREGGLKTWGAAILQGGGLGIFGDFLFQDRTRYGNSWGATLLGPQFAQIEDVVGNWALKNTQRAAKGEETHFAGDAVYLLGRYAPGSTLWQTRLAFQRAVVDQLALLIDPRTPERFQRIEREALKAADQDFWWRPGETTPSRAPNLLGAQP